MSPSYAGGRLRVDTDITVGQGRLCLPGNHCIVVLTTLGPRYAEQVGMGWKSPSTSLCDSAWVSGMKQKNSLVYRTIWDPWSARPMWSSWPRVPSPSSADCSTIWNCLKPHWNWPTRFWSKRRRVMWPGCSFHCEHFMENTITSSFR